jgi:response regulator RpfG family c-di-GMP phosphodiesterase
MSNDVPATDLTFAAEPAAGPAAAAPWKILIADDEEEIHGVTKLALSSAQFHGRPVQFLDCYTGEDAVKALRDHPDIALVLMDVVMESEHAGLEAVQRIRQQLANPWVRIVLRTGQPGQAPERDVVSRYDIDDYKEKTELTAKKLFTVVHTGLGHYKQLRALERSKQGLRQVIDATATVFQHQSLATMAEGMLQQVAALLNPDSKAVMLRASGFAAMTSGDDHLRVLAGTGPYATCAGRAAQDVVDPDARRLIELARREKANQYGERHFVAYFHSRHGSDSVLYLASPAPIRIDDLDLVSLFCRNISIALENRYLEEQKERAQSEMVVALSEAIEARSRETGNHVRRVAEYSRLLAELSGLDDDTAHLLYLAAPLHDAGKIAIPDAILNKPGSHTEAETEIMRSHAELGRQIFAEHDSPVLKAAAIVAGEHHERWDGLGYPHGYRGEQIHIFGRITALADVFDALTHQRCYKDAWPLRRTLQYLVEERGRRFDPELVDLFMQHLDRFIEVYNRLGDHVEPAEAARSTAAVH